MNKAELRRLAVDLRAELALQPTEVFDPYALATAYGIDVISLGDLPCSPAALEHLQVRRSEVFSGALMPTGNGAVILENDAHVVERRRATVSHEMAHLVLEHPFQMTLVNERGCRTADTGLESEANELGMELLVPFDAALKLAWKDASDEEVADAFQVSVPAARWRMNVTGVRKIVHRTRAKRSGVRLSR